MNEKVKFQPIAVVLICLLPILLYLNALDNAFFFDDHPNILDNPYIRDLKEPSLFLKGVQSYTGIPRTLTTFSFAINYHFHKFTVFGYHLVNLILHILTGILVFLTARVLFRLDWNCPAGSFDEGARSKERRINLLSLLAALIFVSHPIQVNTVAYIVQRTEGLASFFYLLSLYLFAWGSFSEKGRKRLLFLGAGFSFLCAIFSKETGFTAPITLILFDFIFACKTREEKIKRARIYLLFLLILAIYMLFFLRGGVFHLLLRRTTPGSIAPWHYLLTEAEVIIQYFKLLLLPFPAWLNIDHDFPLSKSLFEYSTFFAFSALVALLLAALCLIDKKRLISFSILFFFVVLAPSSSIIPLWDVMVEYRLYLPLFSFSLMAAMAIHGLCQFLTRRYSRSISLGIAFGISVLLLSFYSAVTIGRNQTLHDPLTLWSDAVKKSPYKMRVHHNLGKAYFERGQIDKATEEGEIALRLSANLDRKENVKFVLNLLGGAYFIKGDREGALRMFQQAVDVDPGFATSYYNLGCVYAKGNDKEKALPHLRKAVSLDPKYKEKARTDKDLHNLRGEKEFLEIVR